MADASARKPTSRTGIKKSATPRVHRAKKETEQPTPAVPKEIIRTVGRRKSAIARVRLTPGKGTITVNDKDFTTYFPYFEFWKEIESPLVLTDTRTAVDISIRVYGGGVRGQAEAVRHGIAQGLVKMNPEWKKTLRSEGFITRDPRVKERKKPGLKRARRAPQFSKR
ncbi:30S ribosomal protein S9 [Candidatus Uhrbacteria bacterium]|nr:30S ribosomal protein S9 [Candidatus Uhrbacteria bacterium]